MSVPGERLTAPDLYHYVDWLREAFEAGDQLLEWEEWDRRTGRRRLRVVYQRDRQLARLERVLAHVGEPHRSLMLELVEELKQVRLSRQVPVETLARLRALVSEWDRGRPLLSCGFAYPDGGTCTIAYRSRTRLAEHRRLVHDDPAERA